MPPPPPPRRVPASGTAAILSSSTSAQTFLLNLIFWYVLSLHKPRPAGYIFEPGKHALERSAAFIESRAASCRSPSPLLDGS